MSNNGQTGEFSAYDRIVRLLDEHGADYRLIQHEPEGRTEIASRLRGHHLTKAAKCIVMVIRPDKKTRRFLLAVIPGNRKINLSILKKIMMVRSVGFAPQMVAERLAESVSGAIAPFALHPELELLVDAELLRQDLLYFNAGRLDLSLELSTEEYLRIARPRVEQFAE